MLAYCALSLCIANTDTFHPWKQVKEIQNTLK